LAREAVKLTHSEADLRHRRRPGSNDLEVEAQAQIEVGIKQGLEALVGDAAVTINEVELMPLTVPEQTDFELLGDVVGRSE
jgi:hypothetical protein